MRILITKNGRIIIQDIHPEIKYKGLLTSQKSFVSKKNFNNLTLNSLKYKTIDKSTKNIFHPKKKLKNIEIDDVLSEINSPKMNNSKSVCKMLTIDPNKNLNMPQSVADKYFSTQFDSMNNDNEDKNILPDVLISINKSIEKDASKRGLDYIYNNISSLQTMKENGRNRMMSINTEREDQGHYTMNMNLPKILPSYPLKYIITPKILKKLKKQAIKMEYDSKKDKRLSEDNFRSKVKKDLKTTLELNLKNEINAENTNLISYINKDKEIKVPFVDRLCNFDDNKLRKLNKISQKTMFVQGQEKIIKERIKDKIKTKYRNASETYKDGLENIRCQLMKSEKIINDEEKKIVDKKERYANQYNEAELNWVKSGVLRFFHKNKPPVNCATALVLDK
jgi:hypothetical protein